VFMHQLDMAARGLDENVLVEIVAVSFDGIDRRVQHFNVRAFDIARGCVAAYFPEATPLVSAQIFSPQTRTPLYKEIPVLVGKG
jgi:anaerobic selenocysteine-containing dehydrogenase